MRSQEGSCQTVGATARVYDVTPTGTATQILADARELHSDLSGPSTLLDRPQPPATIRIRCDQNRIFGCGRWNLAKVDTTPIGPGATGCHAFVWCKCSLPLAKCWTLYPPGRGEDS